MTAISHVEILAQRRLPTGTNKCILNRPEHASSLLREKGASSDVSSSLIMKKCGPQINK